MADETKEKGPAKPGVKPAAKPVLKPAAKPAQTGGAGKIPAKSAPKPVAKAPAKPAAKPVAKPPPKPVAKAPSQPQKKAAVTEKAAAKPVTKAAAKLPSKPPKKGAFSSFVSSICGGVGGLCPRFLKNYARETAHVEKGQIPEEWLGAAIIVSFFFAPIFTLLPWILLGFTAPLQLFAGFLLFINVFVVYFFVIYYTILKTHAAVIEFKVLFPRRTFRKLYYSLSHFFPWKFRNQVRQLIIYTGDRKLTPEEWLGGASIVSVLYALIATVVSWGFFGLAPIFAFPVALMVLGLSFFIQYMLLFYSTESRRKGVEEILPDFLELIAANIRAGLTPFASLRSAARKEFGALETEVTYATAKSLGTESFTEALKEVSTTINSEVLERVLNLFTTGLKAGGKLSALLENAAEDITETQELKKQLITSTRMYTLFIIFNITVGSPLMLAISLQFVDMVSGLGDISGGENVLEEFGGGMAAGEMGLDVEFLFNIAIIIIIVNSALASGFIGVINEGSIKNGFRFFPAIAIFTIIVFFAARTLVSGILGGFI